MKGSRCCSHLLQIRCSRALRQRMFFSCQVTQTPCLSTNCFAANRGNNRYHDIKLLARIRVSIMRMVCNSRSHCTLTWTAARGTYTPTARLGFCREKSHTYTYALERMSCANIQCTGSFLSWGGKSISRTGFQPPDLRFIALHAVISRVLHLGDAAEIIDKVHDALFDEGTVPSGNCVLSDEGTPCPTR